MICCKYSSPLNKSALSRRWQQARAPSSHHRWAGHWKTEWLLAKQVHRPALEQVLATSLEQEAIPLEWVLAQFWLAAGKRDERFRIQPLPAVRWTASYALRRGVEL